MTTTLTLAELLDAPPRDLGTSDWHEITQERIDRFAEATGDHQWIHVDVERARRELPYRTTIAHGLLTLSLLPAFFPSVLRIEGLKNSLKYGSDRVRYLNPVPAGSRVPGRIRIEKQGNLSAIVLHVEVRRIELRQTREDAIQTLSVGCFCVVTVKRQKRFFLFLRAFGKRPK